jgi:protein SCO1/2
VALREFAMMLMPNDKRPGLRVLVTAAVIAIGGVAWSFFPSAKTPYPVLPDIKTVESSHRKTGMVLPERTLPGVTVILDDGSSRELSSLLAGKWTLIQFIFTGCSTTCPVQGAIFAKAQSEFTAAGIEVQLLSISIDPLGDDAAALKGWLDKFGRGPGWSAAIPPLDGLGPLLDVLGGRSNGIDVHDARVYLIGPNGKLLFITEEMPNPGFLVQLVKEGRERAVTAD